MQLPWKMAVALACVMQADEKGDFTVSELLHYQLDFIKEKRRTTGKTPKNTVSRVLKELVAHGVLRGREHRGKYKDGNYCIIHERMNEFIQDYITEPDAGSFGERLFARLLTAAGLSFEREVEFDGLKVFGYLRFDFAVWFCGQMFLVEIDGEQHTRPVEIFGGEEGFAKLQLYDTLKNTFCTGHGYKLMRINHKNINWNSMTKIIKQFILSDVECQQVLYTVFALQHLKLPKLIIKRIVSNVLHPE